MRTFLDPLSQAKTCRDADENNDEKPSSRRSVVYPV